MYNAISILVQQCKELAPYYNREMKSTITSKNSNQRGKNTLMFSVKLTRNQLNYLETELY